MRKNKAKEEEKRRLEELARLREEEEAREEEDDGLDVPDVVVTDNAEVQVRLRVSRNILDAEKYVNVDVNKKIRIKKVE